MVASLAFGVVGCGDPVTPADDAPPRPQAATAQQRALRPQALSGPSTQNRCQLVDLASLMTAAPSTRLTLTRGEAASPPEVGGFTLLVETGSTERIQLTPQLGVRGRRVIPARFQAALSTEAGTVALVAGRADAAGLSHYEVWQLGDSAAEDFRVELPIPAPATGSVRRYAVGGQVVFAWTDGRQPPLALRLWVAPGQAPRFDRAYELGPALDLDDARAVQLLRVAVDVRSFAAIVREGAAEAADSEVWLARPHGRVPVPALEEIADIESLAIVGDQVWAIATLEFSRPLVLRILPNGELAGPPEELARDANLPEPLAGGDPARLLVEGRQLLLRRRNGMGDPLLPDTVVATRVEPSLPADVLRDGTRYVVVYQDRDEAGGTWPIRFASVDCAPR